MFNNLSCHVNGAAIQLNTQTNHLCTHLLVFCFLSFKYNNNNDNDKYSKYNNLQIKQEQINRSKEENINKQRLIQNVKSHSANKSICNLQLQKKADENVYKKSKYPSVYNGQLQKIDSAKER